MEYTFIFPATTPLLVTPPQTTTIMVSGSTFPALTMSLSVIPYPTTLEESISLGAAIIMSFSTTTSLATLFK